MRLTLLGSGTSTGVPVPGCRCSVCLSPDPRNNRLRTSAAISSPSGSTILIDASSDFRQQALRAGLARIDAVLFTHSHADHILGIDDLRAFNFIQKQAIPCFGTADTLNDIRHIFSYVFNPDPRYLGGGIPKLDLFEIDGHTPFKVVDHQVVPIPLLHGRLPVTGYRFGELAYLTDVKEIPSASMEQLKGVKYLLLDGLRQEAHKTHLTIPEAVEAAKSIGAEQTWLIHMTHTVEHDATNATLPKAVQLGYDGLEIDFQHAPAA